MQSKGIRYSRRVRIVNLVFPHFYQSLSVFQLTACRCGNEERLCFGNGDTDNQIQDALSDWHEGCDSQINFTVTTPALSTITVPYDPKFCTKVISWCASGSVEQQKCVTSYAAVSDQSSCYCAPKLLSLDYSCMYLNNASCVLTPAALSNMPAYGFCSNFQSVLGSLTDVKWTPNLTASRSSSNIVIDYRSNH